jgi:hypothetical protein
MMLGGVIWGYWATGRLTTATAPAKVMTIDSTEAKIGRLMKKCENIFDRKLLWTLAVSVAAEYSPHAPREDGRLAERDDYTGRDSRSTRDSNA